MSSLILTQVELIGLRYCAVTLCILEREYAKDKPSVSSPYHEGSVPRQHEQTC